MKKKLFTALAIASAGLALGGVALATANSQKATATNVSNTTGYYNIADYGAKANDESFDNAPIINKIIDNMGKSGGTIYIPVGTYYIKSPIRINRSYVSIVGDNYGLRSGIDAGNSKSQAGGGGAMLKLASGVTGVLLKSNDGTRLSGITLRGFQLRGTSNNGFGIKSETDSDGVVIENMVINNVGLGVELKGADAPQIKNNWIAETASSIKLNGSSQQANISGNSIGAQPKGTTIDLENPDRFTITGNNIYPDGGDTINLYNPVHGTITGNTISSYYNGVINMLPNSGHTYGNSNVISNNVISVESWHSNPKGRDSKWGVLHIEGYTNRIDGNSIVMNNAPRNATGILIMKGDNNRMNANSIALGTSSDSKVVINGSANNNVVTNSIANSEFQNGNNHSNKNVPLD